MAASNQTEGFGFNKNDSAHHFRVTIPAKKSDMVLISEHFTIEDESAEQQQLSLAIGQKDNKLRVILKYSTWTAIADEVRAEFNLRLRRATQRAGQWRVPGVTPLARTYGKELVLLAWAIEEADSNLIPHAIQNWKGLQPEERWWLFTMTNAQTGHATNGKGKGWRKAVRYALTENPVAGLDLPSSMAAASTPNTSGPTLWNDSIEDSPAKQTNSNGRVSTSLTGLRLEDEL